MRFPYRKTFPVPGPGFPRIPSDLASVKGGTVASHGEGDPSSATLNTLTSQPPPRDKGSVLTPSHANGRLSSSLEMRNADRLQGSPGMTWDRGFSCFIKSAKAKLGGGGMEAFEIQKE